MTDMNDAIKEYGKALYELASEEEKEELLLEQVLRAREIFRSEKEWLSVLASPAIPTAERLSMLDAVFTDGYEVYLCSFMKLLTEQGHGASIPACLSEYVRLYDEAHGIRNALAVSAVPLSDGQKAALLEKMQRVTGKTLRFSYEVEPSLIGGLRVTVDGTRYEGSVKGRLERLRADIATGYFAVDPEHQTDSLSDSGIKEGGERAWH